MMANALLPFLFLAVWVFLVWMVRKKRIGLFRDLMGPELAEKRYRLLKTLLLVAGVSLAAFAANLVVQFVVFDPPDDEGPVAFFIALFFAVVFAIATIGGLVVYLKGRRTT